MLPTLLLPGLAAGQERPRPMPAEAPEGQALVARLREGGLVLFFRHADTRGEPCDRSYRIGDRAGQRNLAPEGRAQAVRLGARLAALGIPIAGPVLAGPVFRARDTAELAFGTARVAVTDSLLADDYAGARLDWVIAEHRRLLAAPVPPGGNRVLVGHRTPAIMVFGDAVAGRAFPEGAALVVAPRGAPADVAPQGAPANVMPQGTPVDVMPQGAASARMRRGEGGTLLGILLLAPLPEGGFHACQ
ncbi:histidine phosphatase family protein [Dankookia sp. GCM10030260]|uniref:histidine phosphatase family protein n=1 Tax=Dankookia sp. GCM10030260 TaxID=3273390 RepID=UPI0036D2D0BE